MTALLARPAVSWPGLVIFGAALRNWPPPALPATTVFRTSVLAGRLFR